MIDEKMSGRLTKSGSLKRNCKNCKHLEWHEQESYESFDESGFFCNYKEYVSEAIESAYLKLFQNDRYLEKSKTCFNKD